MNHNDHNQKNMYTCPMHPNIRQKTLGMCPECGMALVETRGEVSHSGHEHDPAKLPHGDHGAGKHAGHSTNIFAKKFWVSLVLTIPIVLYSPLPQTFLGWSPPIFPGSVFIPALLGSIVFFYGGWIFLSSAWRELKGKAPGMMTLISLAIVTAYSYSVFQVLRGQEETLFWELTTLIVVMLLGHWMEMRAVKGAQGALQELSKLLPDTAEVERNGKTETIALNQLKLGDVIIVRPGGKVAADGEIIEGESDIDEALATGESKPVQKKVGDTVIAGTINGDGSLRVKVTKIGEDTFLAGVMRLVQEAQASKSKLQLLSDKAAFYLTVIAVAAGLLTLFVWIPLRGADFGFTRMVAVLVIACPHALGLAIPLVASISTKMAAQNGFLVRQRLSLEAARNIDVVLFDKTGTLTKGEYGVASIFPVGAADEKEVLQLAASVDAKSEHSVSRAIVKKATQGNITLTPITDFKRLPGRGVSGVINGQTIKVGGRALWSESGLSLAIADRQKIEAENKTGKTIIYILKEKELAGVITLGDIIREESREAIEQLKQQNVKVAMVTGDSQAVAKWVSDELGIDEYFAEVLPEHKADKVKQLQQQGKKVAMVGDGINDAPALTQADVGIAIGAGTNVAIESAGIVLVKNDPRDIPKIIKLSRLTYSKMIQNLFWATGYNIVALPLAAGVAVAWGIVLNPAVSAVFMSLSTVIVAINAVMLRRQSLVSQEVKTA
jgi:Cu2+-exporting ATPase